MKRRQVPLITKRFELGPTGASPMARPHKPSPAMRGPERTRPQEGGAALVADWDRRRSGSPPHYGTDPWDWLHVEFAMRGAMRVLRQLPHSQGERPGGHRTAWPDWLPDYPGPAGVTWTRPTPAQIDQTLEVVSWFGPIGPPRVKRGLVCYVTGLKWARIRQITGDSRTPYTLRTRVYREEFRRIAGDLNSAQRLLPKDLASVPLFGL